MHKITKRDECTWTMWRYKSCSARDTKTSSQLLCKLFCGSHVCGLYLEWLVQDESVEIFELDS